MKKINVVAEIGCNHQGKITKAMELISFAKKCGCDVVKFQKRYNRKLLTQKEYNTPHPDPQNSFGSTYGEHREFLEFTSSQHQALKEFAETVGIDYSCSVWDSHSAWEILQLNPKHIKIPSACNLDEQIYKQLERYEGTLHVSFGMTTAEEMDFIFERCLNHFHGEKLVLYVCTSAYPVDPKDTYVLDIADLSLSVSEFDFPIEIGYSGHHRDTFIDLVAIGAGADWIERHFTFDHDAKGTDHRASLDRVQMEKLVYLIRTYAEPSLSYKDGLIVEVEESARKKLKRRIE